MRVKFYKVPVHVQSEVTRNKEKAEIEILPEDFDEGIFYLFEGQLSGVTYDKDLKLSELNIQGSMITSPLTPKEIMNLKLIEYDSESKS